MKYKLSDIIEICKGRLINGDSNLVCSTYSIDTRTLTKGDVYIGIKGENYDGGNFYKEALKKGAAALIVNEDIPVDFQNYENIPCVKVKDTTIALQTLAKDKRNKYNIPVIAVTGSVGKTSTKDMISKVLSTKYNVLKTEGNYNNEIGMPLTILRLENHNCMVLELGMNHLKEISLLTNIARPTIAVITNIGTSHIGNLGSRENILKAKLEIIEGLSGPLIINNDNDLLHNFKDYNNIITVGIDNESNYTAKDISLTSTSASFKVKDDTVTIPFASKPFIYNSLFAYAVGDILNVYDKVLALKNVSLSSSRLEKFKNRREVTIIDDTYNASVDSMENALNILSNYKNRKIAILGDMLEIEGFEEKLHTKVGKIVAECNIDILITIGNLSKFIASGAIENEFNKKNIYTFTNLDDVYPLLDKILQKDDVVLLKASHSMNFKKIVEYLKRI